MNLSYFDEEINIKLNKSIFNEDDIKNFVRGFVRFLNIEEYLKDINIGFAKVKGNLARYDLVTNNLDIDLSLMIKDAHNGYGLDNDSELVLFTNIMIIFTLVHEITHIYQNAHKNDFGALPSIIRKEFGLFSILSTKEYNKYWGFFTSEREAVINSYEYILFLLKYVIKNDDMYDYFFDNLAEVLASGYKVKRKEIVSPLQIVNKRFSNKSLPKITTNDIYNSLKYGYPISMCEYNLYDSKSKEIITKKITCMKKEDMVS